MWIKYKLDSTKVENHFLRHYQTPLGGKGFFLPNDTNIYLGAGLVPKTTKWGFNNVLLPPPTLKDIRKTKFYD